jgi:pre-mRNA-processing factor 39
MEGGTAPAQVLAGSAVAAASSTASPAPPTELERLAARAAADPLDWPSWNALLVAADKDGALETIRTVYSGFLSRFPFCFGFWKKWAEHEVKKASSEAEGVRNCISVFERGVVAAAPSVELWVAYIAFLVRQVESARPEVAEGNAPLTQSAIGPDDVRR